ncbi:bacterial Ig-like domain-containing protein, partial [Enterococcus faecalis]|nr:bacterial Ig-like domain-containing protein [Enterococcus faecalis]
MQRMLKIGAVGLLLIMNVNTSTVVNALETEPSHNESYAISQTSVEAAVINPIISGDKVITGILPAYGTTDLGEKIKLTYSTAAMLSLNNQIYNQDTISGNQMFNYSVTPLNDDYYTFTFTLPDNKSFVSGDKLNWFIIPATLPEGAPQLSQKLSSEVIVRDTQANIKVHDSEIFVGDNWTAEDNFDSATDKNGNAVDFSQITVDDSQVDTSKAGKYEVSYTYEGVTSKATITVIEDKSSVIVHDSELTVGDSWMPQDNFDSATDINGNSVDFSEVDVEGSVDTSKVGTYKVTYTRIISSFFSPSENQGEYSAIATITVKEDPPAKAGEVTAKYIDIDENKISDDVIKSGNIGEDYITEEKKIAGYTFKEVKGNATGKFKEEAQIVTYVYERAEAAPVTVKYVDEKNNELVVSETLNGKIGLPYQSTAKSLTGWTLKETPVNANGTFTDKVQTVTYVYKKMNSDQPIVPPTNIDKENSISSSKPVDVKSNSSLPKAGEQQSSRIWGILG